MGGQLRAMIFMELFKSHIEGCSCLINCVLVLMFITMCKETKLILMINVHVHVDTVHACVYTCGMSV